MNMPNAKELNRIYDALSDQTSKKIYRHRLLYSLLGEKEEITRMIYESSPASALLSASKVCYYGAGAGSGWLVQNNRNVSFVIDKYKTGTLCGLPIISLEDFLKLPDCKEYLIIVTVGKEKLRREIAEELDMPVERVREILKISQEPVSLETPIGEEEDSHLGDFIQDDNVPVPAEAAAQTLLKEQLDEVLGTLTEREQKVLRLRFGMNDGRARTLEEVGKEFDVTRERIRQIEAKALRKLRHPSRSRKLRDYLD